MFGGVVGDFDVEFFFEGHDQFDVVEAVGAQIVDEGGLFGDLFRIGVEVLDEEWLGSQADPEPIIASPIVADGRVYVTSMEATYAIGKRNRSGGAAALKPGPASGKPGGTADATPAHVQLFPYESLLTSGQKQTFQVRLYDASGRLIREEKAGAATWALDQLGGKVGADGIYVAPATATAGFVKATVGGVTGTARVRVIPPLPWTFDFEAAPAAPAAGAKPDPAAEGPPMWWTGAPGKVFQRTVENVGKVLVRPRDETVGRRAQVIMGRPDWSNYTMEADVRGIESRRQRGDIGLINQRYKLVLFGNEQIMELHPWQAADEMTVQVPFEWAANTWYHMKFRVENRSDGTTLAQGKVWKTGDPEPAKWTIEKIDKIGHKQGAPGLYGDGISDLQFDNIKVYKNQ